MGNRETREILENEDSLKTLLFVLAVVPWSLLLVLAVNFVQKRRKHDIVKQDTAKGVKNVQDPNDRTSPNW
jgi:hypothetical protein